MSFWWITPLEEWVFGESAFNIQYMSKIHSTTLLFSAILPAGIQTVIGEFHFLLPWYCNCTKTESIIRVNETSNQQHVVWTSKRRCMDVETTPKRYFLLLSDLLFTLYITFVDFNLSIIFCTKRTSSLCPYGDRLNADAKKGNQLKVLLEGGDLHPNLLRCKGKASAGSLILFSK